MSPQAFRTGCPPGRAPDTPSLPPGGAHAATAEASAGAPRAALQVPSAAGYARPWVVRQLTISTAPQPHLGTTPAVRGFNPPPLHSCAPAAQFLDTFPQYRLERAARCLQRDTRRPCPATPGEFLTDRESRQRQQPATGRRGADQPLHGCPLGFRTRSISARVLTLRPVIFEGSACSCRWTPSLPLFFVTHASRRSP
jgi:hypothetical protein